MKSQAFKAGFQDHCGLWHQCTLAQRVPATVAGGPLYFMKAAKPDVLPDEQMLHLCTDSLSIPFSQKLARQRNCVPFWGLGGFPRSFAMWEFFLDVENTQATDTNRSWLRWDYHQQFTQWITEERAPWLIPSMTYFKYKKAGQLFYRWHHPTGELL